MLVIFSEEQNRRTIRAIIKESVTAWVIRQPQHSFNTREHFSLVSDGALKEQEKWDDLK